MTTEKHSENNTSSKIVGRVIVFIVAGLFIIMTGLYQVPIYVLSFPSSIMAAAQRQKQKRSIHEMKNIGTALDNYYKAQGHYPIQAQTGTLSHALLPETHYTGTFLDGWGKRFYYRSLDGVHYSMFSYGKDEQEGGERFSFAEEDIVYYDGICWLRESDRSLKSCF